MGSSTMFSNDGYKHFSLKETNKIYFEGMHYWYDNRLDLDCRVFFPSFLMYDKGQLAGFGWGVAGKYDYTNRTEYPPLPVLNVRTINSIHFNLRIFLVIFKTCSNLYATIIQSIRWIYINAHLFSSRTFDDSLLNILFLYFLIRIPKKKLFLSRRSDRIRYS